MKKKSLPIPSKRFARHFLLCYIAIFTIGAIGLWLSWEQPYKEFMLTASLAAVVFTGLPLLSTWLLGFVDE